MTKINDDDGLIESNFSPEIAAISSQTSLRDYLREKPRELSQIIAWRSAMRVFPILLGHQSASSQPRSMQSAQLRILSFRSLFISSSALKYPDDEMNAAAAAAGAVGAAAAGAVGAAAAGAVGAAAAGAAAYAAVDAAYAAYAAYAAAADADDWWQLLRHDLNLFEGEQDVISFPLFPDLGGSILPKFVSDNLDQFQQRFGAGTPWSLIYYWYTALLPLDTNSTPYLIFDEKTERKLATQSPEFWGDKKDADGWVYDPKFNPDDVMKRIADLVGYQNDKERFAPSEDVENVGTAKIGVGAGNVNVQIKQNDTPEIQPIGPNLKQVDQVISHNANGDNDALGRAPIAMALARLINNIWQGHNPAAKKEPFKEKNLFSSKPWTGRERLNTDEHQLQSAFVVHIDAPWGGGKTTFVQYLIRILNPYRYSDSPPSWLERLNLKAAQKRDKNYRIPWQIIEIDAWQHCHVEPPWWVFWQDIYSQALKSKRIEQNEQGSNYEPPHDDYDYGQKPWYNISAGAFWLKDLCWRFFSPSAKPLIIIGSVIILVLLTLLVSGVMEWRELKEPLGLIPSTAALIALFAGFYTKSLLPGTPQAAKNYAMGSGDPLDRFRKHFETMIKAIHRPVLIVVDNLDRCPPKYVVELIHGLQTILTSKRIIILLLGDRDWIEKSFDVQYKDMKGIADSSEREFGALFVEKAIQLSFVLPDMSLEDKDNYVRHILGLGSATPDQPETAEMLEELNAAELAAESFETIDSFDERRQKFDDTVEQVKTSQTLSDDAKTQTIRDMSEKLVTRESSDSTVQEAVEHSIKPAIPILPANPRQINLIVSKIALIQSIATIKIDGFSFRGLKWQLLVRWIILADQFPKTWFTLSKIPNLADALCDVDGTEIENEELVKSIKLNKAAMRILDFKTEDELWGNNNPINTEAVEWLIEVMPPTSGKMLEVGTVAKAETSS